MLGLGLDVNSKAILNVAALTAVTHPTRSRYPTQLARELACARLASNP